MGFWEQKKNPIVDKSKLFAIHIIELYKRLISEKKNLFYQNKCCAAVPVSGQMLGKRREDKACLIFIQK